MPWNLIARLAIVEENTDMRSPGDRTLAIFKGVSYFLFATYSCDQENQECNPNVINTVSFTDRIERGWVFLYFGSSLRERAAHAYVSFLTRDAHSHFDRLNHFHPSFFKVYLQKDTLFPGFNGAMKSWVLNFGKGAF